MDKELLRLVIIAVGLSIVLGLILWSVIKNKKRQNNPLGRIDDSLKLDTDNDDFEVVPLEPALDDYQPDPITVASDSAGEVKTEHQAEPEQVKNQRLPKIIQFSIVASADEGFNGRVLADIFAQVGLEYGSMKIYERLDDQRRVDFAVASMVEPGIFPETDLESFYSPGIVFFIQPGELDDPLGIFNDFIQTIELLAAELNGVKWDHNREPLTEETIQKFRGSLT